MLAFIAGFFNFVTELDSNWIGFRALRPARHEDMTAQVVARLTMFYAPAAAVYTALIVKISSEDQAPSALVLCGALGAGTLVFTLQSLAAYFWNQRAAKLRRLRALTVGCEEG
jgi:hypothetical protein